MAWVVVEREFPEPVDADFARQMMAATDGCFRMHGVRHVESVLSSDGRRMTCLLEAPDAESVRIANRQSAMPFTRVWSATVHEP